MILNTDDTIASGSCSEGSAAHGDFVYAIYDLIHDPYETNNLYDSTDEDVMRAKENLYAQAVAYKNSAAEVPEYPRPSKEAKVTWKEHNDYIVPWTKVEDITSSPDYDATKSFPYDCYVSPTSAPSPGTIEVSTSKPTTSKPTAATTAGPTMKGLGSSKPTSSKSGKKPVATEDEDEVEEEEEEEKEEETKTKKSKHSKKESKSKSKSKKKSKTRR